MYYKLYAVDNDKKSTVRGYWTEGGKLYKDNIHIQKYTRRWDLARDINGLFETGEKAAFYTDGLRAIIQTKDGNKSILKHKMVYKRERLSITEVKALLKAYGGITIYDNKKSRGLYHIEVWR